MVVSRGIGEEDPHRDAVVERRVGAQAAAAEAFPDAEAQLVAAGREAGGRELNREMVASGMASLTSRTSPTLHSSLSATSASVGDRSSSAESSL